MAKEDRRITKTKRLLREGLAVLMQQKSVSRITVRELAEYADINRATFYAHYKDVHDLMEQVESEITEDFRRILESNTLEGQGYDLLAFFSDLLAYLQANAALANALLCKYGDMAFIKSLQELIGGFFTKYWKNGEQPFWRYSATYLVAGCTGLIQQWLADGMPESPQEMAAVMVELVSNGLARREIL